MGTYYLTRRRGRQLADYDMTANAETFRLIGFAESLRLVFWDDGGARVMLSILGNPHLETLHKKIHFRRHLAT
jgi:hypothetical protein